MTALQFDLIIRNFGALEGWVDGDDAPDAPGVIRVRSADIDRARTDAQALIDEVERLNAALADSWLALDRIARDAASLSTLLSMAKLASHSSAADNLARTAAALLRAQRAPGYK